MTPTDNKDCLVIMPVEEFSTGYEIGHFRKVYENLIKPSVIKAGFIPISSYDFMRNEVDYGGIIDRIIQASIVIFDLSSHNPGVITGLKIRNAFANKAVVTLKDDQTSVDDEIDTAGYIEYSKNINSGNIALTRFLIAMSLLTIEKTENNNEYIN